MKKNSSATLEREEDEEIGTEQPQTCGREGCNEKATFWCQGCGEISYCFELHSVENWKNHVEDCNICINVGNVFWAVERQILAETEDGEEISAWIPDAMLHVQLDANTGKVIGTQLNADLVESMGEVDTEMDDTPDAISGEVERFRGKSLAIKASKINKVPPGAAVKDVGAIARIQIWIRDRDGREINNEISFDAAKSAVAKRGATGFTFKLKKNVIQNSINNNQIGNEGKLYLNLEYNGRHWTLYGDYTISDSSPGVSKLRGAKRALKRFQQSGRKKAATLIARATKTSHFIRVRGQDSGNVTASVLFERASASFQKRGKLLYSISEVEFHVPDGNDGTDQADPGNAEFLKSQIGFDFEFSESSSAAIGNEVYEVDPEDLVHVATLLENLADMQNEMREDFREAQVSDPARSQELQEKMNYISGIRGILNDHAMVLKREEDGEIEAEDIPHSVEVAIGQAQQLLIEDNVFSRGWRRLTGARGFKKMTTSDLFAIYSENVDAITQGQADMKEMSKEFSTAESIERVLSDRSRRTPISTVSGYDVYVKKRAELATAKRRRKTISQQKKRDIKKQKDSDLNV